MKIEDKPVEVKHSTGEWDVIPFNLGGIEIPVDASDQIKQNLCRMVVACWDLYSDPQLAVIREYITNARDIQLRLIKDKNLLDQYPNSEPETPIFIEVPNETNNTFTVRDYGTGMNEEQMKMFFASYGSSDKGDTNDEAGAFGIGAKSAFSIGPSFCVISYQDGIKTVYHVFGGENEFGKLVKLKKTFPTDELNGLEIKIPIPRNDIERFTTKLTKYLSTFDFPVNTRLEVPKLTNWLHGDDWVLSNEYAKGVYVRIGGTVYPLDRWALGLRTVPRDWRTISRDNQLITAKNLFQQFQRISVIIDLPIGSVKYPRSRESVMIDENLRSVITEKMHDIYDSMLSYFDKRNGEKCKDLWEAGVKVAKLRKQFQHLSGLPLYNQLHTTTKDKKVITDIIPLSNLYELNPVIGITNRMTKKRVDAITATERGDYLLFNDTGKVQYNKYIWSLYLKPDGDTKENWKQTKAFLLTGSWFCVLQEFKRLGISIERVTKLSSLTPISPNKKKPKTRALKPQYWEFGGYNRWSGCGVSPRDWLPIIENELPAKEKGLKLKALVYKASWITDDPRFNQNTVEGWNCLSYLRYHDNRNIPIFGFRQKEYDKIEMNTVEEYIVRYMKRDAKNIKKTFHLEKHENATIFQHIQDTYRFKLTGSLSTSINGGTPEYKKVMKWQGVTIAELKRSIEIVQFVEKFQAMGLKTSFIYKELGFKDLDNRIKTEALPISKEFTLNYHKIIEQHPILKYAATAPVEIIDAVIKENK